MVDVFWLEQTALDVPPGDLWLGPGERKRLADLRIPKRRDDWRLGRWTAKLAVTCYLDLASEDLSAIEVLPAATGAPVVYRNGRPVPISLSISHRDAVGLCVVAEHDVHTGCDLEVVEPHSDAFLADYFTSAEQRLVIRGPAEDRSALMSLLWSAKESVLKALEQGLRMDPHQVSITVCDYGTCDGRWRPFEARVTGWDLFHGWWDRQRRLIRTVTGAPRPGVPIPLKRQTPQGTKYTG